MLLIASYNLQLTLEYKICLAWYLILNVHQVHYTYFATNFARFSDLVSKSYKCLQSSCITHNMQSVQRQYSVKAVGGGQLYGCVIYVPSFTASLAVPPCWGHNGLKTYKEMWVEYKMCLIQGNVLSDFNKSKAIVVYDIVPYNSS